MNIARLKPWILCGCVALAAATLPSCGSSESFGSSGAGFNTDSTGGTDGNDGADATDGAGADAGDGEPPPPEDEQAATLPGPAAGDSHVFIASGRLDAVVRIDGASLDLDLLEVGLDPTSIAAFGSGDDLGVVVTNTGSEDISIISKAETDAEPTISTFDAGAAVNRLAVAPDSSSAVAWYAPTAGEPIDIGSLQEVRVVRLEAGKLAVFTVGVGFRPLSVSFDDESAYVVTERGVSVIDVGSLKGDAFAPPVPVSPDPLESALDREVLVARGTTAIVRRPAADEVRLIDLTSQEATLVPTSSPPTDIDLSPDETEVVAVLRATSEVVRFGLDTPDQVTVLDMGELPAGQATMTPDGRYAVLYTSVQSKEIPDPEGGPPTILGPRNEWLVLLDMDAGTQRVVALEKGVKAVEASADGKRAVVLHDRWTETKVTTSASQLTADIDRAYGFSVVDIASGYAKLELTTVSPLGVLLTPGGERGFVLLPNPEPSGENALIDIDLGSFAIRSIRLGSPPVHAVLVGDRLAISQDHPSGRVTFLTLGTGKTETVTGFQLNGLIR